jgi:Flp pilus assembly protein TadB
MPTLSLDLVKMAAILGALLAAILILLPARLNPRSPKSRQRAVELALTSATRRSRREVLRRQRERIAAEKLETAGLTRRRRLLLWLALGALFYALIFYVSDSLIFPLWFTPMGVIIVHFYVERRYREVEERLSEQVIEASRRMASDLSSGYNLAWVLATFAKAEETESPLRDIFVRINIARNQGEQTHEAVKAEMLTADNRLLWRFLKIIQEGADPSVSLDEKILVSRARSFYETNLKMSSVIADARTEKAAVQSTRQMMIGLVAAAFCANMIFSGPASYVQMFHLMIGQALFLVIIGLVGIAWWLSERVVQIKVT